MKGKEDDKKKKREGTTIFIEKDVADKLDAYISRHPGLTRKSFVEKAVAYFEGTGMDLEVWAFQTETAVPLSQVTERLEAAVRQTEEERAFRQSLQKFMNDFSNRQKALPSLEELNGKNIVLQNEINEKNKEIEGFRQRVAALRTSIDAETGWGSKTRKIKLVEEFLQFYLDMR